MKTSQPNFRRVPPRVFKVVNVGGSYVRVTSRKRNGGPAPHPVKTDSNS